MLCLCDIMMICRREPTNTRKARRAFALPFIEFTCLCVCLLCKIYRFSDTHIIHNDATCLLPLRACFACVLASQPNNHLPPPTSRPLPIVWQNIKTISNTPNSESFNVCRRVALCISAGVLVWLVWLDWREGSHRLSCKNIVTPAHGARCCVARIQYIQYNIQYIHTYISIICDDDDMGCVARNADTQTHSET